MHTGGVMNLLDGDLIVRWESEKKHTDFTMHIPNERVSGGILDLAGFQMP